MSIPSRSGGLWVRLARVPRRVAFLGAFVLVLGGLFLPGALGGTLLLLLAAGLATLLVRTWPVIPTSMRALRLLVLALLATGALLKIFWGAW